jgi:hypothetical protein
MDSLPRTAAAHTVMWGFALVQRYSSTLNDYGIERGTMYLNCYDEQEGRSMKRMQMLLPCLVVAALPCLAQETSTSKVIDTSVTETLKILHRQLDEEYAKLRKNSPGKFKLQCAAGECVRLCTGGQSCSCTTDGASCSCSACQ